MTTREEDRHADSSIGVSVRILVIALDAELRQQAFDRMAAAGFAVDAVADPRSAGRRLSRDRYSALLWEAGTPEPPPDPTPRIAISIDLLRAADTLEERVREVLEDRSGPASDDPSLDSTGPASERFDLP